MDVYEARQKILKMSEEERAAYNLQTCPRCLGTGKYSYCTMYGDTCFKCSGVGFVKIPTKKTKKVSA